MMPLTPTEQLTTLPAYGVACASRQLSLQRHGSSGQASERFSPPAYQLSEPRDAAGFPVPLPALPRTARLAPGALSPYALPTVEHALPGLADAFSSRTPSTARAPSTMPRVGATLASSTMPTTLRRSHRMAGDLELGGMGTPKMKRSFARAHATSLSVATIVAITVGLSLAVRYA